MTPFVRLVPFVLATVISTACAQPAPRSADVSATVEVAIRLTVNAVLSDAFATQVIASTRATVTAVALGGTGVIQTISTRGPTATARPTATPMPASTPKPAPTATPSSEVLMPGQEGRIWTDGVGQ
jgi:hypothetical protein